MHHAGTAYDFKFYWNSHLKMIIMMISRLQSSWFSDTILKLQFNQFSTAKGRAAHLLRAHGLKWVVSVSAILYQKGKLVA